MSLGDISLTIESEINKYCPEKPDNSIDSRDFSANKPTRIVWQFAAKKKNAKQKAVKNFILLNINSLACPQQLLNLLLHFLIVQLNRCNLYSFE